MFLELFFEVNNFFWFDSIEVTSDTSVNDTDLLSDRHWLVLILLQKFGKTLTTRKKLLSGGIHIGTELSEGSDFTVLGQIQLHGTRNLFHGLHLGGRSDTGDGKTDVDGWTFQKTRVEVENITWVGFTSWWTSQKKRHLTVSNSLFGQIVIEDDSVTAVISEPFSHGATRVWSQVLEWGRDNGR